MTKAVNENMWKPDRQAKTPIYRQIAGHMEGRIRSGEFPPGSVLPSERKLAAMLRVNRTTVIQAYEELRSLGLVERAVGSGTRVAGPAAGTVKTPNWRQYLESGTFLPNVPAMRRIRSELNVEAPVIDFASGELSADLFPNDIVRKLLQERPYSGYLGYDDPQGFRPLREALSRFLRRYLNVEASESSLIVTSGSQQSLFLITHCLLQPGDAVAVEDPSYCRSLSLFESAGLKVLRLRADRREGLDPDDIVALHRRHRLKMIFTNPNFQNPTGTVLSAERKRRLLDVAAEWGIPIVEDDPFSLTAFDGNVPPPLRSMDAGGQVLYIGSLSKIAASGLRIGWLAAPGSVVSRLADARRQMDFGLSTIPQWVAAEFLDSGEFDRHLRDLRLKLAYKLDSLRVALDAHLPGETEYRVPEGGLNLWVQWRRPIDDLRLFEQAVREGVVYVPGSVYGSDADCFRLCFARPRLDQIEEGVVRLSEALRKIAGPTPS
nr:PLP-dependent aminotransferase family protein [Cohnella thermotolerans]